MTITGYLVTRTGLAVYFPEKRKTSNVYETVELSVDAVLKFESNGYIDYTVKSFGLNDRKKALQYVNDRLSKEFKDNNTVASLI